MDLSAQRIETRVARETPEVQAWAQLLRAHSALTRRFSTELLTMHGLTLNGYEVLLRRGPTTVHVMTASAQNGVNSIRTIPMR